MPQRLLFAVLALLVPSYATAQGSAPRPAVATAAIAPVVIRSCVLCHSAGNIAPFVYAHYEDVSSRAEQIRGDLLTQRMTPWHANPQFGVFANNTALTPAEISTLFAWVCVCQCRRLCPSGWEQGRRLGRHASVGQLYRATRRSEPSTGLGIIEVYEVP